MQKIIEHLSKDKVLAVAVEHAPPQPLEVKTDLYPELIRAIVGQQLSVKAASTIHGRFVALFSNNYPEPSTLLQMPEDTLRAVGLSYQKASYVRNIAQFSMANELNSSYLQQLTDEEVIGYLTKIKGVGRWTVEMLLMFSLGREDVLPLGDLGIQKAITQLYGLKSQKKALIQELQEISSAWRPYRTFASMSLWRWNDNKPVI